MRHSGWAMIQVLFLISIWGVMIPVTIMASIQILRVADQLQVRMITTQEILYCNRIIREDLLRSDVQFRIKNNMLQRIQSNQLFTNITRFWRLSELHYSHQADLSHLQLVGPNQQINIQMVLKK